MKRSQTNDHKSQVTNSQPLEQGAKVRPESPYPFLVESAVHLYYDKGSTTFQRQEQLPFAPYVAAIGGLVLEVYPAKSAEEACGSTRLGFEVDDIGTLVEQLRSRDVPIVSDVKSSQWGKRAVVRDPDGRSVELVQRG